MKNTSEIIKKNNPTPQNLVEINNLVNAKLPVQISKNTESKQNPNLKEIVQKEPVAQKHNPRGIYVATNEPSPVSELAANSPYANLIKKLKHK